MCRVGAASGVVNLPAGDLESGAEDLGAHELRHDDGCMAAR